MEINENNVALTIGRSDNIIFRIDNDGVLWYRKDDQLVKFEDEKELTIMLLSIISGRYGVNFNDKREFFEYIAKACRDDKINDVLR